MPPQEAAFHAWATRYHKEYASASERTEAFKNWKENDQLVRDHNDQPLPFTLAHNRFSDMSPIEFRTAMLTPDLAQRKLVLDSSSLKRLAVHTRGDYGLKELLPQQVDWQAMGAITDVEDQAMCAGSYAFSSVAAIESAMFIASGMKAPPRRLSRQQLLDCDYGPESHVNADHGCNGGLPAKAMGWVSLHGGLCLEDDYAFLSYTGNRYSCRVLSCDAQVTVDGYKDVAHLDEDALLDAVAQQPVTVAVAASTPAFQLYKGGVFDHPLCNDAPLDHTMLVVGYGITREGISYWKVKNSWGKSWGIDGYMMMKRNVNMCGIAEMPVYPLGVRRVAATPTLPPPAAPASPHPRHHFGPDSVPQPRVYDGSCHQPKEGDIKLTDYPSGHVLMWYDGEWHTVCQENSNLAFAQVACKMLGFKQVFYQGSLSARGDFPMVSSPHCVGHEETMMDCRFDPVYRNSYCSTYRNMLAMYVTCGNGEMSNYTYHCGYKSPDASSLGAMKVVPTAEVLPAEQGGSSRAHGRSPAGAADARGFPVALTAAAAAGVIAVAAVAARSLTSRRHKASADAVPMA